MLFIDKWFGKWYGHHLSHLSSNRFRKIIIIFSHSDFSLAIGNWQLAGQKAVYYFIWSGYKKGDCMCLLKVICNYFSCERRLYMFSSPRAICTDHWPHNPWTKLRRSADGVKKFIIEIYSTAGEQMTVSEVKITYYCNMRRANRQFFDSFIFHSVPNVTKFNFFSIKHLLFIQFVEVPFLNCCPVFLLTLNTTLDFGPNCYRLHQFSNEIILFSSIEFWIIQHLHKTQNFRM